MNAGFISFRFAGTDGVSLEVQKWVSVLERLQWKSHFLCGEADTPEEVTIVEPEFHFNHPEILEITEESFTHQYRSPALTEKIHKKRNGIKGHIHHFIETFNIKLLIIENALSIPMNIPLSMAIVEVIAETNIHTIIHHHDFYWERERYLLNCVQDILQGYFPPNLHNVKHVTINSLAQHQLGFRCGITSTIIPNVMDYKSHPTTQDEYGKTVKKALNIDEDSFCILQPTRIVQRKGIEHAIEIAQKLERNTTLIISHESGDEGNEYKQRVLEFADLLGVDLRLISNRIGQKRDKNENGNIYTLSDIYNMADIVTYPSLIEGFGNAFLEAVYFKKLLIVNCFPVYVTDIKPKGFHCLEFRNFISNNFMQAIHTTIDDTELVHDMITKNFMIAKKHYSLNNLHLKLQNIIVEYIGVYNHS